VVSRARLVEELWGEDPPETAAKMVQIYVSRLRKLLEGERASGTSLVTRPPGYVLRVDPESVDASRFERLVREGREALAAGDPGGASRALRQALALWRGTPLGEFEGEPFAQTEGARLEELRLSALEDRIDADLALGRHGDLVGELEALVAEHPLRERVRGQLMLALYRSGRQAEALAAYQRTREHLVEVLGIEPGRPLQALEKAILVQDSALDPPPASSLPQAVADATAPVAPRLGTRKPVSVLLAEVVREGERLDPEAAHAVMSRALSVAARTAERHGAVVETRSSGEILAVFGVPAVHEDDAFRALRAAFELRAALEALSQETESTWLVRLRARAAIRTGEAVAGDPDGAGSLVGAEPVELAAKLVQSAAPGEIVMGAETERLVRHGVVAEPVEGEGAGGEAAPAWRVTGLLAGAATVARRFDAPMVGRERELLALLEAFERVARDGSSFLCAVLGPAGIGKTRLAEELRAALAHEATVLAGRCLPSGEGTTFSPLAEIVVQAAGERSREGVAALLAGEPEGDLAAAHVAGALAFSEAAGTKEETFWAFRKLFRALATERPLVLVLDDLHWAEPTLLELVEQVVDWSGAAPILVLALARPELQEGEASWAAGKPNATTLRLEPLTAEESDLLLENLLGQAQLSEASRTRILEAAEGNPLFIEQMLAMLGEAPAASGEPAVPATIHALLAARIDRLPPGERAVLERASVVGREFWRDALVALAPAGEGGTVDVHLQALVRKELIASARIPARQAESFVFRHVLIRESVYDSLPKAARADLHEDAAAVLDRLAGERPEEHDEGVGYHLERAYRYRADLGLLEERDRELAVRAAGKLAAAGRRAYAVGDLPAAVGLLVRAVELLEPSSAARAEVLTDLGEALRETGEFARARSVLHEAKEIAVANGDPAAAAHARLIELRARAQVDPAVTPDEFDRLGAEAIELFEQAGDERRLAKAWFVRAWGPWVQGRVTEAEGALRRAIEHARRAGDERTEAQSLNLFVGAGFFGPSPVAEAVRRCEDVVASLPEQRRIVASAFRALAGLRAMEGRFAEARRLAVQDREILEELGLRVAAAMATEVYGLVELLADDAPAAERQLRAGYETLEEMGETSILPNLAAMLAQALYAQGRSEEALRYSEISESAAARDDVAPQVQWRAVRAKILAAAGEDDAAARLAENAVALARSAPDFPLLLADALLDQAEVLRTAGHWSEARGALEEARGLYERKGNVVSAARARDAIAKLDSKQGTSTPAS